MATSPPGPTPLALPRQRPSLALPQQVKSRKPSIASTTSSAHPLRQTSFPPPDSLEAQHAAAEDGLRFSPSQASQGSLEDEFSDTEIQSAIGTEDGSGRKRKRGDKRPRGRPAKHPARMGSVSLVNGEDGGTPTTTTHRRGATSVVTADNADDEDDGDADEDEDLTLASGGRLPLYEGGQMTNAEFEAYTGQRSLFRHYMDHLDRQPLTERPGLTMRDMRERYDAWQRAKLRPADVRRLVNQTLSQSVPANVVTVVSAYTKMFAGLLVEEARAVQGEWMAVEEKRADGAENAVFKRLKMAHEMWEEDGEGEEMDGGPDRPSTNSSSATLEDAPTEGKPNPPANSPPIKSESSPSQPTNGSTSQQVPPPTSNSTTSPTQPLCPGGAAGLQSSLEECDRGPLLPDHLRESLRRYRKGRKGGNVGFTGLSLEGKEVAASMIGGRRLFK